MTKAERLELPSNRAALAARRRLAERELAATRVPAARRLLAIDRRRIVIAEDAAE